MGNAIVTRMAAGIAGAISRYDSITVEPVPYGATPFVGYGLPVKYVAGLAVPVGAGDTAPLVTGILVRPYPQTSPTGGSGLGVSIPPTTGIANVMRRGYVTVVCNNGAPALAGAVYVRVATPSGPKVVGGFEAAADGGNTILLTNATWNGAADATGNAEIAFNI